MGRPYSNDLRERIVRTVESGVSRRAAAKQFDVSTSSVIKLLRRWHETGSVSPGHVGAPSGSKLDAHGEWLLRLILDQPDLTLEEIRTRLAEREVSACVSSIWYFFDDRGISFKKNGSRQRTGARRRGRGPRKLERGSAVA